jgi:hypothetical protein
MTMIQLIDGQDGEYRPGACNIGAAEIRRRRDTGVALAIVTAALAVALVAVGAPPWARLLVFFPAAGAAIGILQARFRFCVAFALAGVRNFGPLGVPEKVADANAHRADLVAATRLISLSVAVAAAIAIVLALLPL